MAKGQAFNVDLNPKFLFYRLSISLAHGNVIPQELTGEINIGSHAHPSDPHRKVPGAWNLKKRGYIEWQEEAL